MRQHRRLLVAVLASIAIAIPVLAATRLVGKTVGGEPTYVGAGTTRDNADAASVKRQGNWGTYTDSMPQGGNYLWGTPQSVITWDMGQLDAGSYLLEATWYAYPTASAAATYTVGVNLPASGAVDPASERSVLTANQTASTNTTFAWQPVGVVNVRSGGNVTVTLSSGDTGHLFADAVRLTKRSVSSSSASSVPVSSVRSSAPFPVPATDPCRTVTPTAGRRWQNQANPYDVDHNGVVNAADNDRLVSYINSVPANSVLPAAGSVSAYYDVNGDGYATAIDSAMIVNYLSCRGGTSSVQSSTSAVLGECGDGKDNDGDGYADGQDPGCTGTVPRESMEVTFVPAVSNFPKELRPGANLAFTVNVANTGPDHAVLPVKVTIATNGATFIPSQSNAACIASSTGDAVTCTVTDRFPAGSTRSFPVTFSTGWTQSTCDYAAMGGGRFVSATVTVSSQGLGGSATLNAGTVRMDCSSVATSSASNECADGKDNDGDGRVDAQDAGCGPNGRTGGLKEAGHASGSWRTHDAAGFTQEGRRVMQGDTYDVPLVFTNDGPDSMPPRNFTLVKLDANTDITFELVGPDAADCTVVTSRTAVETTVTCAARRLGVGGMLTPVLRLSSITAKACAVPLSSAYPSTYPSSVPLTVQLRNPFVGDLTIPFTVLCASATSSSSSSSRSSTASCKQTVCAESNAACTARGGSPNFIEQRGIDGKMVKTYLGCVQGAGVSCTVSAPCVSASSVTQVSSVKPPQPAVSKLLDNDDTARYHPGSFTKGASYRLSFWSAKMSNRVDTYAATQKTPAGTPAQWNAGALPAGMYRLFQSPSVGSTEDISTEVSAISVLTQCTWGSSSPSCARTLRTWPASTAAASDQAPADVQESMDYAAPRNSYGQTPSLQRYPVPVSTYKTPFTYVGVFVVPEGSGDVVIARAATCKSAGSRTSCPTADMFFVESVPVTQDSFCNGQASTTPCSSSRSSTSSQATVSSRSSVSSVRSVPVTVIQDSFCNGQASTTPCNSSRSSTSSQATVSSRSSVSSVRSVPVTVIQDFFCNGQASPTPCSSLRSSSQATVSSRSSVTSVTPPTPGSQPPVVSRASSTQTSVGTSASSAFVTGTTCGDGVATAPELCDPGADSLQCVLAGTASCLRCTACTQVIFDDAGSAFYATPSFRQDPTKTYRISESPTASAWALWNAGTLQPGTYRIGISWPGTVQDGLADVRISGAYQAESGTLRSLDLGQWSVSQKEAARDATVGGMGYRMLGTVTVPDRPLAVSVFIANTYGRNAAIDTVLVERVR